MSTATDEISISREEMTRRHIKSFYGLDLRRKMRVTFEGRPGVITGFRDAYVLARLDDGEKARLHPTWRVGYPDLDIPEDWS
ncbi:hypothetical protein [Nocardioides pakistanensis]